MNYVEVICPRCGWHHAAISSAYVSSEDLSCCTKCFNCGASSQDFVLAVGSEGQSGYTLQPVVVPKRHIERNTQADAVDLVGRFLARQK